MKTRIAALVALAVIGISAVVSPAHAYYYYYGRPYYRPVVVRPYPYVYVRPRVVVVPRPVVVVRPAPVVIAPY